MTLVIFLFMEILYLQPNKIVATKSYHEEITLYRSVFSDCFICLQ